MNVGRSEITAMRIKLRDSEALLSQLTIAISQLQDSITSRVLDDNSVEVLTHLYNLAELAKRR